MFGRKIPDKVMAPTTSPSGTEGQRMEKKPGNDRAPAASRTEVPARRLNSGGVETVIGEDTSIVGGKIISKGTLRIDGRVEGEVQAEEAVVVGPTGTVKSNITARNVAISGKVFGNILAHERLEIQPTGEVHGDVRTAAGALMVESGAKLEGKCIMGLGEKTPETADFTQALSEHCARLETVPRPANPAPGKP